MAPYVTSDKINRRTVLTIALMVSLGFCGLGVAMAGEDEGTAVPGPDATEVADTVAVLSAAAEAQGICYGWRLQDGTNVVSVGSNLGDQVEVDSDPVRCPRWMEVVADVIYTPETSEAYDSASVWVDSSEDIDERAFTDEFDGLGLGESDFIDEPGWAITRAAVTLPLLAAEAGLAPAAPVAAAEPTVAPSPLPDAGSDLWRDRWGYFLTGSAMLLVAVFLVVIGLVQWGRGRRLAQAARPRT